MRGYRAISQERCSIFLQKTSSISNYQCHWTIRYEWSGTFKIVLSVNVTISSVQGLNGPNSYLLYESYLSLYWSSKFEAVVMNSTSGVPYIHTTYCVFHGSNESEHMYREY